MSVQYFQREIWSKKIQDALELEGRLVRHTNRAYEGDAEYAKTVRILGVGDPKVDAYAGTVTYEQMDDKKQNLDIDFQEYFAFVVDDVDKAQSMPGLPEKYQEKAVKRLNQRREINIGRLVAGKAVNTANEKAGTYTTTSDVAIIPYKDYYTRTGTNPNYVYTRVKSPVLADIATYYELTTGTTYKEGATHVTTASSATQNLIKVAVDTALTNLRIRNNEDGGYLEIDPMTYTIFKNNIVELSTNNPEMIRRGVVGMYDDYEVTRTNAIMNDGSYQWCFAHSGNAIAFVGQINKVEAMRLEGTFGDGIRGLDTYGMKIIAQDELEVIKVPVTASVPSA
jgi:hypothetical protein